MVSDKRAMKLKYLIFFVITIAVVLAFILFILLQPFSHHPDIVQWSKTFGGVEDEEGWFVQETGDTIMVLGNTHSFGSGDSDIWLIKLDSNGTEIWSKFFGGAKYDDARCVRATLDGGYIIAGETESYENSSLDIWIIKTDSNGTELWNKTFGGVNDDVCNDIRQISNDKYIIAGHTQSFSNSWDAWIICIDSNGTEIWNKTFGGKADDGASSITQTSDSGYIIVGYTNTYSKDEGDLWIIKTDSNGTELWNKTFGGNKDDSGVWVQRTKDGNYIIAGYTNSYGKGKSDIWIMKIKDI
jgi:regulation of enolase protein 1 (concanavalin A-like superfamily)